MKRSLQLATWLSLLSIAVAFALPTTARALDLEAFEFNDTAGTPLSGAANSVNPANLWIEDPGSVPSGMLPSDVRGGVYNIVKGSVVLESNYLQIGNISSGTRYLVVRLSKWDFESFDSTRLEEFRLAFLNDDTGNSGSTITAQMNIRRNLVGNIEIAGDAIGTGATNLPAPAPLATIQSSPFTAVLEINKTSNTYKVYYKDNTNPTQVLGMGAIAPTRGGNSIRLAANNDFSAFNSNYPLDPPFEVVAVDRIAVTDTNPFTDLITLEVDRGTGAMTLKNTSGVGLTGLELYSIASTVGAFDPTKWKTVAGNYDSAGNGSVDNALWSVTTSSKTQLAEAFQSGDGGGLTNNQNVVLSVPAGNTWLKGPFEDVQMTLSFSGGVTRSVNVNFIGNGGLKYISGDLNFDNTITTADWLTFIANSETNLSGLSRAEAYQRGDLTGDGLNNIADFVAFNTAYDGANGAGAFVEMLASVPEPGSAILLFAGALAFVTHRRHRSARAILEQHTDSPSTACRPHLRDSIMPRIYMSIRFFLVAVFALAASHARAVILEDFPFSDVNSTPLDATENVAHSGNNWFLSGSSWDPSTVFNGAYRITKSSTGLASAHMDIANVSTGKAWLVAEFAGWNYTATPSGTSEEVRFAFIDNNDAVPPAGTTITAQMDIRRSATALQLVGIGALGTGATNVAGNFALPLVRTTPFTMVLELDKNLDQYSVYYKDNAAAFALLGTAELGASTLNPGDRDGNAIRFAPTGQFNDTGEFVDINRIYLTNVSPIGSVTPVALTLEAKSNGGLALKNTTSSPISLDSYRIASATNALNFAGWNSLSDQGVSAIDGPDGGLIVGDGVGETWDEAGGSSDAVLAESFLLGSTTLAPNDSLSLGSGFKIGGDQNLTFQYHDFTTGSTVTGDISYVTVPGGVPGDYNGNGIVDGADYVVWRKHNGQLGGGTPSVGDGNGDGNVNTADYTYWRARFGNTSGSGAGLSGETVPEPTALSLFALAPISLLTNLRRRKPSGAVEN